MNLYVFENVLTDYSDGMVIIAEWTLEDAQAIAFQEYAQPWREDTLEQFLNRESGFQIPAGVYPLAESITPGVVHQVYGGG